MGFQAVAGFGSRDSHRLCRDFGMRFRDRLFRVWGLACMEISITRAPSPTSLKDPKKTHQAILEP